MSENLLDLKINKLSHVQYQQKKTEGSLQSAELYLTPEPTLEGTNINITRDEAANKIIYEVPVAGTGSVGVTQLSSVPSDSEETKAATPMGVQAAINNLEAEDPTAEDNPTDNPIITFIDSIAQTAGVISATKKKLPTASVDGTAGIIALTNDINSDEDKAATPKAVNTAISAAVSTAITTATANANAYTHTELGKLCVVAPDVPVEGTTTATAFIDSISQADGKITATKKNLPEGTISQKGIIQLSNEVNSDDQTVAATSYALKNHYVIAGQKADTTLGTSATAEGYDTTASGQYSHAGGQGTTAQYAAQTAIGRYNANKKNTLFEVGNGTEVTRQNAFEVLADGRAKVYGTPKEAADVVNMSAISRSNNTLYYNILRDITTVFGNNENKIIIIPKGTTSITSDTLDEDILKTVSIVAIPDGVTSIGDSAFDSCESLTSVVIGDGVTSIGDNAFHNCKSLTVMNIPDSVTSIGEKAFYNCKKLTSIEIPNSVTSIGKEAFSNCSSLKSVVIPDSVTSIVDSTFYWCSGLTSVVIPDSVTSIGWRAFSVCSKLTEITLPFVGATKDGTSNTHFGYIFGASDDYDQEYQVPSSLQKVTITSATSIGNYAFRDCKSLTSVVIPDSVTSIGSAAFWGCGSLTSVVIGNSVTRIGNDAFAACSKLNTVYYNGTASDWSEISINTMNNGNSYLKNATRYYYSESQPTEEGNYWHYDENGEVVVW